jgi:pimeloyl-ACP methyl ester carboxylesterase
MPAPPRRSPLLAALVALAVVAGACSDGDDDLAVPATAPAPSASATDGGDAGDGVPSTTAIDPGPPPTIEWSGSSGAEEGRLEVPLDHDDPDAGTIELALLRIPAGDPANRIGSLLVNPGGPGASGIELAAAAPFFFGDEVLDRFDVIGWDPRGVGDSTAVSCGDGEFLDRFAAADPVPDSPAEEAEVDALAEQFVANCVAESGELLAHVSTVDAAHDMELIRRALGEERISYLGFSYGTLLGATYADLHPDRVRAFVLDGAYSRSLSSSELTEQQAIGFEGTLDAFLDRCRAEGCAFAPDADPGAVLDQVLAAIDARPLPTSDPERDLTIGLAITGLVFTLYSDDSWPMLDAGLAQARFDKRGDELLRFADLYNERRPNGEWGSSTAAFVAIGCADSAPIPPEELEAIGARLEDAAPRFGDFFTSGDSCADWPVEPVDDTSPFRAAGAPPILVIATTGDPATPYEWGVGLAEELESGVLLTNVGDTHTAYAEGKPCVDEVVDAYLVDLEVPAARTRCE